MYLLISFPDLHRIVNQNIRRSLKPDYVIALYFMLFLHFLASLSFTPKERYLFVNQDVSSQYLFQMRNLG